MDNYIFLTFLLLIVLLLIIATICYYFIKNHSKQKDGINDNKKLVSNNELKEIDIKNCTLLDAILL